MKEQMRLHHILRVWATSSSAADAARPLGLSRRTLYDRREKASVTALRDAFVTLQGEAEAQLAARRTEAAHFLLATEGRLDDLTHQRWMLSGENTQPSNANEPYWRARMTRCAPRCSVSPGRGCSPCPGTG
jgi:hypothetical protein